MSEVTTFSMITVKRMTESTYVNFKSVISKHVNHTDGYNLLTSLLEIR